MKPKTRMITAVWGKKYIEVFLTVSMPSYLAPGNIPALSAGTELEYIILTLKKDIPIFKKIEQFKELQRHAKVNFICIEDLVTTGVYGVTLTLAYFRAIKSLGEDALDTYCIFMNSDFILADGSLKSLLPYFEEGNNLVLAPSFRGVEEKILPRLAEFQDESQPHLSIPPRELVKLALQHPHPTVMAKTFNQRHTKSCYPNNLYWQVDNNTILGKYYLLFMLVIKPQQLPSTISCYCDYSFVPEFCPTATAEVITDSDDFFMLELQDEPYESEYVKEGQNSIAFAGKTLNSWTTPEHRRYSDATLYFHSDSLPDNVQLEEGKFDQTKKAIDLAQTSSPIPHDLHPYWIGGVEAWLQLKSSERGLKYSAADELRPIFSPTGCKTSEKTLRWKIYDYLDDLLSIKTRIRGQDSNQIAESIKHLANLDADSRILYIADTICFDKMMKGVRAEVCKKYFLNCYSGGLVGTGKYDSLVMIVRDQNLPLAEEALTRALSSVVDGGRVDILYYKKLEQLSGCSTAYHLSRLLGAPLENKRFASKKIGKLQERAMRKLLTSLRYIPYSFSLAFLKVLIGCACCLPFAISFWATPTSEKLHFRQGWLQLSGTKTTFNSK